MKQPKPVTPPLKLFAAGAVLWTTATVFQIFGLILDLSVAFILCSSAVTALYRTGKSLDYMVHMSAFQKERSDATG